MNKDTRVPVQPFAASTVYRICVNSRKSPTLRGYDCVGASYPQGVRGLFFMAKKFYTYTLAYPESMGGGVFYVGKGTGRRIHQHETDARSVPHVKSHKNHAIRKIWASGEQVAKTILAYFESEQDAYLYETALIFLIRPYGNLTNLTDGGDGATGVAITEATRQKMRLRTKKSMFPGGDKMTDEEYKRERSRLNMARYRRRKGIPERRTISKSEADIFALLYASGQSCHDIAEAYNIDEEAIRVRLIKDGVTMRDRYAFTERQRQKLGDANRRRVVTEAHKQNMSLAQKARRQREGVAK